MTDKYTFTDKTIELFLDIPESHKNEALSHLMTKLKPQEIKSLIPTKTIKEITDEAYNEGWNDALGEISIPDPK